jgi:hypothetical protein
MVRTNRSLLGCLPGLLAWAVAAGCAPPIPSAPPTKVNRAILVCADSDQEVFDELKPRFTRLDVSRFADTPECLRAKSAALEIGHTCLDSEQDCSTPSYIDGKPIATPASAYDAVLLFPQLIHGSLTAKTVTTTKVVSAGGASGGLGGQGGVSRGGQHAKTVTENDIVSSPETDYTGEVFVFDPRPGQLHLGKRFKNVAPDLVRDLMRELLRSREL